jgi:6-pyruvoyltetrahydropterin/6-carboxytetrahydropterin synthase
MITVTRRIEFDAGHRIPDHKSKCRNAHGHRYVLEATIHGAIVAAKGESDNGMIADFGNLKQIMQDSVGDKWDHAFICCATDLDMVAALARLGHEHKTVLLVDVPTVENLVISAAGAISAEIRRWSDDTGADIQLVHVRLYETPNCWADWHTADPSVKV